MTVVIMDRLGYFSFYGKSKQRRLSDQLSEGCLYTRMALTLTRNIITSDQVATQKPIYGRLAIGY